MLPEVREAPAAGHCPVCAGALAEGRVVLCARCETAHHLDCIEYGGGCAVYACGSPAYRSPGARLEWVARPAAPSTLPAKPAPRESGAVRTLARPLVRVGARRVARSQVAATVTAAALLLAAVVALATLPPHTIALFRKLLSGFIELAFLQAWSFAVLVLTAVTAGWVTLSVGFRATHLGLGFLFHRADTSEYVLDRAGRRLVRRSSVLSLPTGERSWHATSIVAIRVIADAEGGADAAAPVRLEAVLTGGSTLVLADDNNAYLHGYHWSELARIAQRLAAELDAPLEWLLPWKPRPKPGEAH